MKLFPANKNLGVLFGIWIGVRCIARAGRGKRGMRMVEVYK